MKNLLSYIFLLGALQILCAQLESAHWYFGRNAGLDFSSGAPVVVFDGELETTEGCATISDEEGNLLFYTDGTWVFNRNHTIMPNGRNLLGDPSSTQSAIIVPYPGESHLYYIFTVGADDLATPWTTNNQGFNYYLVDMTLDNGLGDVLPFGPGNKLMELTSEKVTAVAHKNNRYFWVITHFEDKFYSYLVTNSGLSTTPVVSQIGPLIDPRVYPVNSRGYIKTSPNGKKIAIAHLSNLNLIDFPLGEPISGNSNFANAYNGYAAVYDFDDETGMVSNEVTLSTVGSPYGVEFSFESKYLYVEYDYHSPHPNNSIIKSELIQYDLNAADVSGSGVIIFNQYTPYSDLFRARGALQLALDKKIYYTTTHRNSGIYRGDFLSVIHEPDSPGLDANFQYNAIRVNNSQNPFHYVTYGLPPFITSFFRATIIFEGEILNSGTCLGNEVSFSINSNTEIVAVNWDFGDGNSSTEFSPTHTYSAAGTYVVTANLTTENDNISISREITIHPLPEALNATLPECDFNSDGIALFTLSEADVLVTTQVGNTISYHISLEDANADINPLPNIYTNISNPQTIYVRIKSPLGCVNISELTLITQPQTVKIASNLFLCDLNSDGVETFNLSESIPPIESLYGENVTVLSFHATIYDAEMNLNPLPPNYQNTSNPQTIYARVQTSGCTDVVSFQLILYALPFVDLEDVEICPDASWTFDAGSGFTSYQWNGLQGADIGQPTNQSQITISVPGTYSLIVTNQENCEYEEFFTVKEKALPVITEIVVSNSDIASVFVSGDSPFEYSLNGTFWQSSNQFPNLPPGDYTVWVRDQTGCISIQKGFGILDIPNFISPNDDGYNDTWVIRGISNYDDVQIQIFDRYGKMFVNTRNNFDAAIWDGKYLGRVVNSGTYWYIITVSDGRKYVGTISVRNY